MKVSELIAMLQELPQDHQVVMSKDGEGNSFSPFSDYGIGKYEPDSTWSGDFTSYKHDSDDLLDPEECDTICLWPVN